MKRTHLPFIILVFSMVACYTPTNNVFSSEKTKDVDFKTYKTFAWLPSKDTAGYNKLASQKNVERDLSAAVAAQLTKRGMMLDTVNPDCLFTYTLVLNKTYQMDQQPPPIYAPNTQPGLIPGQYNVYYNIPPTYTGYYDPNSNDGYRKVTTYRDGSLIIDMLDRKSNKIVWRSTAEGKVDEKERQGVRQTVATIVPVMFKKFPSN